MVFQQWCTVLGIGNYVISAWLTNSNCHVVWWRYSIVYWSITVWQSGFCVDPSPDWITCKISSSRCWTAVNFPAFGHNFSKAGILFQEKKKVQSKAVAFFSFFLPLSSKAGICKCQLLEFVLLHFNPSCDCTVEKRVELK